MTKQEHTPGPWTIILNGKYETPSIVGNGPDTQKIVPICRIKDCYPNGKVQANARLIASAPILLSVLKDIADFSLSSKIAQQNPSEWQGGFMEWAQEIASNAIKEATLNKI